MNPLNPPSKPALDALWVLLLAFALGSTVAALAAEPLTSLFGETVRRDWLLQLFAATGFFILPGVWWRTRAQLLNRSELPAPAPRETRPTVLLVWLLIPALAAFSLESLSWYWSDFLRTFPSLTAVWDTENSQIERIKLLLDAPDLLDRWGVFVVLVPLAALGEEFFFRGTLLPLWEQAYGQRWALLLSTVLFAAAHLSLSQLPFLLGSGLMLGWVYQQTGRWEIAAGAHFLHNGLTWLVTQFVDSNSYGFTEQPPHPAAVSIATAIAAGVLVYLAHRLKTASSPR